MDWLTILATDVCRQRRPKHAHSHCRDVGVVTGFHSLVVRRRKSSHSEVVRFMRLQHFRCADFPSALVIHFANYAPNPGQRYFQPLRLRSDGSKQRSLRVAEPGWPRLDRYALYRCAWAMLFQVKLQELQQYLGVLHRHWKAESANPAIRNRLPLFFPGIS